MTGSDWLFAMLCLGIVLLSAGMLITQRALHAVGFFLCQCLVVFVCYVFFRASYLAAMQLVVYVGGGVVLMMYAAITTKRRPPKKRKPWHKKLFACLLVLPIGYCLVSLTVPDSQGMGAQAKSLPVQYDVVGLGRALMTTHVYALELLGLLLLLALVGAVVLATHLTQDNTKK